MRVMYYDNYEGQNNRDWYRPEGRRFLPDLAHRAFLHTGFLRIQQGGITRLERAEGITLDPQGIGEQELHAAYPLTQFFLLNEIGAPLVGELYAISGEFGRVNFTNDRGGVDYHRVMATLNGVARTLYRFGCFLTVQSAVLRSPRSIGVGLGCGLRCGVLA